jgi:tetratricopeptide (TPR) repeat protein
MNANLANMIGNNRWTSMVYNMPFTKVCFVVLIMIVVILKPVESASAEVRLNNDAKYKEDYDKLLATPPKNGDDKDERLKYLAKLALAAGLTRAYDKAEQHWRETIKIEPNWGVLHTNLSVVLGLQQKYDDAIKEARYGKIIDPKAGMHAELVICSWEWRLGKKDQAMKRFQAIEIPGGHYDLLVYYACKSCFYADIGDEDVLKESIEKALSLDVDDIYRHSLERHIMFDPYRAKAWFIGLAGEPLAPTK